MVKKIKCINIITLILIFIFMAEYLYFIIQYLLTYDEYYIETPYIIIGAIIFIIFGITFFIIVMMSLFLIKSKFNVLY